MAMRNSATPPTGLASVAPPPDGDALCRALLDSRQRWRDLVSLACDLVFEADEQGYFTFVAPDQVLGWSAAALIGTDCEALLAAPAGMARSNPFRPTAATPRQRVWLRRGDGGVACVSLAAMPLLEDSILVGSRGIGLDITEVDAGEAALASALRRGEVLDHILWEMREEVLAPRMMEVTLSELARAQGAEGAAVIDLLAAPGSRPVLHEVGSGLSEVLPAARAMLSPPPPGHAGGEIADGRKLLVCPTLTRLGDGVGLLLWRGPEGRAWDAEEGQLLEATATLIRIILEHDAIQREMARQARTDPLTGLLNRRAFQEEVTRHIDRLDREGLHGTLMYVDLDRLKWLNDNWGHDAGDEALLLVTTLLRDATRPTDLVARLGGDEFALWLDGADVLTAAERAEMLRLAAPRVLVVERPEGSSVLSLSIGIADRQPGSCEPIDSLLRRADQAMYEVKRSGRGQWRVSRAVPT
jgi:diguanylate cyclase (GGDEF)-like protein